MRPSPLNPLHAQAEASFAPYAEPRSGESGGIQSAPIEVVTTYGELELEYAALRKHCVLLDLPHRGIVEVKGSDRLGFLNNMVTQELMEPLVKGKPREPMSANSWRASFWLNRKGRIDADVRVINLEDRVLLEMDAHAVPRAITGLLSYVISEDVSIRDLTQETHRLAIHGPTGPALLPALLAASGAGETPEGERAVTVRIAGAECIAFRDDVTGEAGLELICPASSVQAIFRALIEAGHDPAAEHATLGEAGAGPARQAARVDSGSHLGTRIRLRPAGWHAFNIARIEAGTPLYNLDFGADSLPAESGVLLERVSFTKGCYLGQEIVARMHARGHPKQRLVAIRFASPGEDDPREPATGTPLSLEGGSEVVGTVTSATIAPMLSRSPIAFAMVKYAHIAPGTKLLAQTSAGPLPGEIQPTLRFWTRPEKP